MTRTEARSRPRGLNHPAYERAMGRIAKAHVWIHRRTDREIPIVVLEPC
jgi:hypothetical protein